MGDPTPEALEQLLELAQTDAEIRRLRRHLDSLPEQQALDALVAERQELEEQRGERGLELDAAQSAADKEDREVDVLRERLAAEQQRMYGGAITNPKELQSMKAEIEAVERRIDEHELAELEAMERSEQISAAIAELDQRLEELAGQISGAEQARDEAASTVLAEIAELEVAVDRQREPLDEDMLARFDDAAARFGGGAVARLDGDRCSACGISLSYADVNELFEGPPLSTCPQCQRLMVVTTA